MAEPLLSLTGVHAGYGGTEVLRGVNFAVHAGEIVTVLGPNGAGKSTMSRTISGIVRAWRGSIRFKAAPIEREAPAKIVAAGLIHVPEGRRIFPNMTVGENLDLGTYRRARRSRAENRERVFSLFPRLAERQSQRAGTLSGGEQQMLALARGLSVNPSLLLLDELSMGLAPIIVEQLYEIVAQVAKTGVSILVVEQFARTVLGVADYAAIMLHGKIVSVGQPADLEDELSAAYLGG